MKNIFVAGGTGYLGRPLIETLMRDGFAVTAVVRAKSKDKLPGGCGAIVGDVLHAETYRDAVPEGSVFVHLVGTPHPAPWKGREFQSIDLVSLEQSVAAAKQARASRFVFVSVAQPAPVMKAYIDVREKCEGIIRQSRLNATIIRPWYVLGPGHYWPYLLIPIYWIVEALPTTRESAVRLGLVTRQEMVCALAAAAKSIAPGVTVVETAGIREAGKSAH